MTHFSESTTGGATADELRAGVAPRKDTDAADYHISHAIEDVPERTGINRCKVFAAIKNGHLTARKIGRSTIIEDGELRRWIGALPAKGRQPSTV
jgi:hypothetical protein